MPDAEPGESRRSLAGWNGAGMIPGVWMEPKRRSPCRAFGRLCLPAGRRRVTLVLALLAVSGACHQRRQAGPVVVPNEHLGPLTIAVAPALNQSGSADFDADRFADLMASELSFVKGVEVVGVSRVLAVLGAEGAGSVESPDHALKLRSVLGVDALLVFAVTEYDPYDPPIIGITAQLYGARAGRGGGRVDPASLSRQARPERAEAGPRGPGLLAQSQRVFDGSHRSVLEEVKEFAARRGAEASPYGWRKYVVSQQHYIRYCCHATLRDLFASQGRNGEVQGNEHER